MKKVSNSNVQIQNMDQFLTVLKNSQKLPNVSRETPEETLKKSLLGTIKKSVLNESSIEELLGYMEITQYNSYPNFIGYDISVFDLTKLVLENKNNPRLPVDGKFIAFYTKTSNSIILQNNEKDYLIGLGKSTNFRSLSEIATFLGCEIVNYTDGNKLRTKVSKHRLERQNDVSRETQNRILQDFDLLSVQAKTIKRAISKGVSLESYEEKMLEKQAFVANELQRIEDLKKVNALSISAEMPEMIK